MNWYVTIKRYYDAGYYTPAQVQIFVTANKITSAQAADITEESAA
ncbi:XkdX family protein [Paenibacillus rhizophilus]|uniref:XkdX family protein n=1 Tax=Paenibacillus rhizophilus TaxID=1850366 RepID=A0A3N9P9X9_9BACL|nr:XkdX family protein [Paenibacillus rhizophilus]RQW11854.1 XkdX family protein [Paenibacillus rhizophilus]